MASSGTSIGTGGRGGGGGVSIIWFGLSPQSQFHGAQFHQSEIHFQNLIAH
jgi:hypothetical protein